MVDFQSFATSNLCPFVYCFISDVQMEELENESYELFNEALVRLPTGL